MQCKDIFYILTRCWWRCFLRVKGDQVHVGDKGGVWWWKKWANWSDIHLTVIFFCLLFLSLFFLYLFVYLQCGSSRRLSWNLNLQIKCWQDNVDRNMAGISIASIDVHVWYAERETRGHVWPTFLLNYSFENILSCRKSYKLFRLLLPILYLYKSLLFLLMLTTFWPIVTHKTTEKHKCNDWSGIKLLLNFSSIWFTTTTKLEVKK